MVSSIFGMVFYQLGKADILSTITLIFYETKTICKWVIELSKTYILRLVQAKYSNWFYSFDKLFWDKFNAKHIKFYGRTIDKFIDTILTYRNYQLFLNQTPPNQTVFNEKRMKNLWTETTMNVRFEKMVFAVGLFIMQF